MAISKIRKVEFTFVSMKAMKEFKVRVHPTDHANPFEIETKHLDLVSEEDIDEYIQVLQLAKEAYLKENY